MPSCLAIDPGQSLGLALVHVAHPRHQVAAVRLLLPDPWQDMPRVVEAVRRLVGSEPIGNPALVIERNAFTPRGDVGPRNAGEVAWSQGFKVGLLVEALRPYTEGPPRFVGSGEWRRSMLVYAGRQGLVLTEPTKASIEASRPRTPGRQVESVQSLGGGRFSVTYRCGHQEDIGGGIEAIREARCMTCQAIENQRSPGQDLSQAWKATACRFVESLWPEVYAGLKASASSRILGKIERPDHELPGLDDACEAIAMGIWGVETSG